MEASIFTFPVLLKGNRSFFSKQLGINFSCEQIGLILIFSTYIHTHIHILLQLPKKRVFQLQIKQKKIQRTLIDK